MMSSGKILRVVLCITVVTGMILTSACGQAPLPDTEEPDPGTGPAGPPGDPEPDKGVPELPAEVLWRLTHDEGFVEGAAFSPQGTLLAVCGLGAPEGIAFG